MASRKPLHPNAKRIASPAVRDKIRQAIGKKLQKADADDVEQKVYVRLLEIVDRLPAGDDPLLALTFVITEGKVADKLNGADRSDGGHDDPSAIERALPPHARVSPQQREELRALLVYVHKEEREGRISPGTLPIAKRLAKGETFDEIAAHTGVPASTLRSMMTRARENLRADWKVYSGLGGTVIALLIYLGLTRDGDRVGAPRPPNEEPSETTSAPAPETPAQAAARLRREAKAACDARDWTTCEARLDAASKVDPTSNARREVIDMRTAIAQGKSGTPPPPPATPR
jgi:DNA-directed RNA polymerase specialized sigma24 family protein